MAYPELVSRVGFQNSQIKGLVKVSASNFSKGVIRVYLKKIMVGGVSGQPETPLDTPLVGETGLKRGPQPMGPYRYLLPLTRYFHTKLHSRPTGPYARIHKGGSKWKGKCKK